MKRMIIISLLLAAALFMSACTHMPVAPTSTPTMTDAEKEEMYQAMAEAIIFQTQTQYAIDNPSPTPTDTATPTPAYTPTSILPLIPPTATEPPRPMLSVGRSNVVVYPIGDPTNRNGSYVPMDTLYVEVCYFNAGSLTWNGNYKAAVVNHGGGGITPAEVYLNKDVGPDGYACFSFQSYNPEQSLGMHCPTFQLYTDGGAAVRNGQASGCWTIH